MNQTYQSLLICQLCGCPGTPASVAPELGRAPSSRRILWIAKPRHADVCTCISATYDEEINVGPGMSEAGEADVVGKRHAEPLTTKIFIAKHI